MTRPLHARYAPVTRLLHRADASANSERFFDCFKRSDHWAEYLGCRQMEATHRVTEDDFTTYRFLGVGGFGSVVAAVKKVELPPPVTWRSRGGLVAVSWWLHDVP